MIQAKTKNLILTVLTFLLAVSVALGVAFLPDATRAETVTAKIEGGSGVTVYISGENVTKKDGAYVYEPAATCCVDDKITVTVVNESAIFESMTVNGQTYTTPVAKIGASEASLEISVTTRAATESDKGLYFGNPYVIDSEDAYGDLCIVLRGKAPSGLSEDLEKAAERFGFVNPSEAQTALQYGYFRLTDTILVAGKEDVFGIGSTIEGAVPFSGCFDFAGNYITMFVHNGGNLSYSTEGVADIGVFGYVQGYETAACLLRNVSVKGSFAFTNSNAESGTYLLNIGAAVGHAEGNVVLDGITSSMSVTADTNTSINIGGVFGTLETNVDSWSDIAYDGSYANLKAVSNGNAATVCVGMLAGRIKDCYCNSFVDASTNCTLTSSSLNAISGDAITGGVVGRIRAIDGSVLLRNIQIKSNGVTTLSSVVDNSGCTDYTVSDGVIMNTDKSALIARAVTGGIYGALGTVSSNQIYLYEVAFEKGHSEALLDIFASTNDTASIGNPIAGGLVGYYNGTATALQYIPREDASNGEAANFFNCNVDVESLQNGFGPAFAGGLFGINSFNLPEGEEAYVYNMTNPEAENAEYVRVSARQTSSSIKKDNNACSVTAGFVSGHFQKGYSVKNITLNVENGRVEAKREVGSTAVGNICAGGLTGHVVGETGSTIENVTLNLKNSAVEGLGASFDSTFGNQQGNNVCVGGLIGHVQSYGTSSSVGLKDLTLHFSYEGVDERVSDYAVRGVQNAVSGNSDYCTEGYVGGMFGLYQNCYATDLSVSSVGDKALVSYYSANSPNTAAAGGLIGNTVVKADHSASVSEATVRNLKVFGSAYHSGNSAEFDLYIGGAFGVLYSEGKGGTQNYTKIFVYDTDVFAIGEKTISTYAGGIAGGIWWKGTVNLTDSLFANGEVRATSVAYNAFASGIAGYMRNSPTVTNCVCVDSAVTAISEDGKAGVAGIALDAGAVQETVQNCYTNALLYASGKTTYKAGAVLVYEGSYSANYTKNNYFVAENAFDNYTDYTVSDIPAYASGDSFKGSSGYIGLTTENSAIANTATLQTNNSVSVYGNVTLSDTVTLALSGDINSFTLNGSTVTANSAGIVYAGLSVKAADSESYQLCSYPIICNGTESETLKLSLTDGDTGDEISLSNAAGYISGKSSGVSYYYAAINVGQTQINGSNAAQSILASATGAAITCKYYSATPTDLNGLGTEDTGWTESAEGTLRARARSIYAAKGNVVSASVFNGAVKIKKTSADSSFTIRFDPDRELQSPIYTVVEYYTSTDELSAYVIIEWIPNYVTGLEIRPSEDTQALGVDENGAYLFTKEDTVLFEAFVSHRFSVQTFGVEYKFSSETTDFAVHENGYIAKDQSVTEGTVKCEILTSEGISATATVKYLTDITLTTELSGASFSSDQRRVLQGVDYTFTVSPLAGHGLEPTVNVKIDGTTYSLSSFDYDVADGVYTVTVSGNNLQTAQSLAIEVNFPSVYYIVFDKRIGSTIEERFYYTVVEEGTTLDSDFYNEISENIAATRDGYTLQGYYLIADAKNMNGYSNSFEDFCSDGWTVSGPMEFFARWTYNVVVETPPNVTIVSGFDSDFCEEDSIVPINTNEGFSFIIEIPENWIGEPRFELYTQLNGVWTNVTAYCVTNGYENGSLLADRYITGTLYLKVYNDSVEFIVGDAEASPDADVIYPDGIFTVVYTVNYGDEIDTDSAAMKEGVVFKFNGFALPEGTVLRVYRHIDGKPTDTGTYTVEGSAESVGINDFTDMKTGSKMSAVTTASGKISSETYYLVAVLPNHNADGAADANIVVDAKYTPATKKTVGYGVVYDNVSLPETEHECSVDYGVVAPETNYGYSVTVSGDSYTLTFTDRVLAEGVPDRRHEGVYYVWRVQGTAVSGADAVCTTNTATYYLATSSLTLIVTGDAQIDLLEVRNVIDPASGSVVYSYPNT